MKNGIDYLKAYPKASLLYYSQLIIQSIIAIAVEMRALMASSSCVLKPAATWPRGAVPSRQIRGSRSSVRTEAALFDKERQAEIRYFDARGAAETTRMVFAAAKMPFKVVQSVLI